MINNCHDQKNLLVPKIFHSLVSDGRKRQNHVLPILYIPCYDSYLTLLRYPDLDHENIQGCTYLMQTVNFFENGGPIAMQTISHHT